MVDVGGKPETEREALARARLRLRPATLRAIRRNALAKGDVLATARLAGIQAAKRTAELIPLCHPLRLSSIQIEIDARRSELWIMARVRARDRTGVEMEALVAAAVAALTVYDMCKAVDRGMTVTELKLLEKHGGRRGSFIAEEITGMAAGRRTPTGRGFAARARSA
jgi:cyclic pyranopterin phosphate synthase